MIITRAQPHHDQDLSQLDSACFTAPERWSIGSWNGELTADDRLVLIVPGLDDQLVAAATFQLVGNTADLHRVMVAPDHRGHNLATRLLRLGLEWAREGGAERMLLEVRHDNDAAIRLYRRLGFGAIAIRVDYYGPGVDALIMERTLESDIETGESL